MNLPFIIHSRGKLIDKWNVLNTFTGSTGPQGSHESPRITSATRWVNIRKNFVVTGITGPGNVAINWAAIHKNVIGKSKK